MHVCQGIKAESPPNIAASLALAHSPGLATRQRVLKIGITPLHGAIVRVRTYPLLVSIHLSPETTQPAEFLWIQSHDRHMDVT